MATGVDPVVQLHTHSGYSLLDGKSSVEEIVQAAVEDGAPAVAITDHGQMPAAVELISRAQKAGIRPIPGMEAYHAPDRHSRSRGEAGEKFNFHLILLAVSNEGYRNLMRMSSTAWLEGMYNKPRLDNEVLARHSDGVVATTACLGSMVNQALLQGDYPAARRLTGELKDIFTSDRLFVEIMNHGMPDQLRILPDQLRLADDLGLRLLATNDSHYTARSEAAAHDALLCIGTGSKLADKDRFRFESDQHWIRNSEEMRALFPNEDFPGACDNTLRVAEMAAVNLQLNSSYHIPQFPLPTGFSTSGAYLTHLTQVGAAKLYGRGSWDGVPPDAKKRIEYELGVIDGPGFNDYFCILADVIQWSKSQGIAVGPGRGSVAGSVVAYCTGITTICPLTHGLFFERFLNPGRKSMPDIDVDFEPARRPEVFQYMVRKYGADRVAHISTYGMIRAKKAIRNAARVLGHPVSVGDTLSKMYPPAVMQVNAPLDAILAPREADSGGWGTWWRNGELIREKYKRDPASKEVLDLARSIEGTVDQAGVHPAALLITPGPLTDYVPLRTSDLDDIPVAQYDKDWTEAIGGLKMDLLVLINLGMLRRTQELILQDLGKKVDVWNPPLDDPGVFRMLSKGDTDGVFQMESPGVRDLLIRMQPDSFKDIAATIALYRPGPMGSDIHIEYAERKNRRRPVQALHPDMLDILEQTQGLIVYQESVMSLAMHFAGYDATEADDFRKAMGKKNADVMAAQYDKFVQGCQTKGYTEKLALQLWEMIEPFSGYAFNLAHAVSYGMISYITAWLRVHYPAQYAAACIDYMSEDKVALQVSASRRAGIQVYAPDINVSYGGAATSENAIWIGIGRIAHCGSKVISNVIAERQANGPFADMGDFLVRTCTGMGVNIKVATNLIMAGAFDQLHPSRRAMLEHLPAMMAAAKAIVANDDSQFGESLFELDDVDSTMSEFVLEGEDYPDQELLTQGLSVLGFYVGRHPYSLVENKIPAAVEQGRIPAAAVPVGHPSLVDGVDGVQVYGVIIDVVASKTRSGGSMVKFNLEVGSGDQIAGILFGAQLDPTLTGKLVLATGRVKEDNFGDEEGGALTVLATSVEELRLEDVREVIQPPALRLATVDGEAAEAAPARRTRRTTPPQALPEPQRAAPPAPMDAPPSITPHYVFYPDTTDELRALRDILTAYGSGTVPVVIHFANKEIRHPELRFDLDEDRVELITSETGVPSRVVG